MVDKLAIDKRLWQQGELKMGKNYYKQLREKCRNPDSAHVALSHSTGADDVGEPLAEALTAMIEKSRDFSLIEHYFRRRRT